MTLQIVPIRALKDNYIWCIINPILHCAVVVDSRRGFTCEAVS